LGRGIIGLPNSNSLIPNTYPDYSILVERAEKAEKGVNSLDYRDTRSIDTPASFTASDAQRLISETGGWMFHPQYPVFQFLIYARHIGLDHDKEKIALLGILSL
jgi:hypothetical protein